MAKLCFGGGYLAMGGGLWSSMAGGETESRRVPAFPKRCANFGNEAEMSLTPPAWSAGAFDGHASASRLLASAFQSSMAAIQRAAAASASSAAAPWGASGTFRRGVRYLLRGRPAASLGVSGGFSEVSGGFLGCVRWSDAGVKGVGRGWRNRRTRAQRDRTRGREAAGRRGERWWTGHREPVDGGKGGAGWG